MKQLICLLLCVRAIGVRVLALKLTHFTLIDGEFQFGCVEAYKWKFATNHDLLKLTGFI